LPWIYLLEDLSTLSSRWYPQITYHRAPHKPFLLLSMIYLIAQGRITEDLREPSYELVDTYEVFVSKRVQIEQNLPGHVLTLRDRNIFTPVENQYRPAQDNFDYHRKNALLKGRKSNGGSVV
jgi:hypothetical protein